jgi:hypothetical protein
MLYRIFNGLLITIRLSLYLDKNLMIGKTPDSTRGNLESGPIRVDSVRKPIS